MQTQICREDVRAHFPSLASGFGFLENAGGSQLPVCVIDAMARFMHESYVQTAASYPASERASAEAAKAHETALAILGGEGAGKAAFGASSTSLVHMLAGCFARKLKPGDEVVVSVANHEANIGAWVLLQDFGINVQWWDLDEDAGIPTMSGLQRVLGEKTKIVAFPQTSNLLGDVADVGEICSLVRQAGALSVVDGVAYASHGLPKVEEWGADFYFFSFYKVYGPHLGILFGRDDAWASLKGPNHFFVSDQEVPRKFELGCLPYEALAGINAIGDYFCFLAGADRFDRKAVEGAYAAMNELESGLAARLVSYLGAKPGVRILGPLNDDRVPTVSFVSDRVSSDLVSSHVNRHDIGIKHGHMYSYRLCEALGISPDPGVVRASAVHYNTPGEIDRLCELLDEVL